MKTKALTAATFALLVSLTGCTGPTPTVANQPLNEAPKSDDSLGLNEHGNLQKEVGEEGAVLFPGTDREGIIFKVTAIEKDPECTGDPVWYMPPENGLFVALTFEITTSDDYLELMAANEPLRIFWNDWKVFTPSGSSMETTPAGVGCFNEEEQVPLDLPAGTRTIGKYVLDVPSDAVSVAWYPSYIHGVGKEGWEWPLD